MKCKNCGAKLVLYNEIKGYEYHSYMCEHCGGQIRSEITKHLLSVRAYSRFKILPRNQVSWLKHMREQLREITV